jgi:general secretion pathway protein B
MSYILEALAKSEQARQQLATAPKYSLLPLVRGEQAQSRLWPYVLAAALVVNAVVLYFWLKPVSPGGAAATRIDKATHATEAPIGQGPSSALRSFPADKPVSNAANPSPLESLPPQSRPERITSTRIQAPTEAPSGTTAKTAKSLATELPTQPVTQPASKAIGSSAAGPALATTPARAENSVPRTETGSAAEPSTVPPQELPPITVAGYISDDGAGGMVIVNDKLVREGDEISPGLKLEKILRDGLVFNYKGQQFRR